MAKKEEKKAAAPTKKASVAKVAPPKKAKAAAAPSNKAEADDNNSKTARTDYFRGDLTTCKISSAEPPAWSSELNGTWCVAYVESISGSEPQFAITKGHELRFGSNGVGTASLMAPTDPYSYLEGELSMGALCEQRFHQRNPVKLIWSYGWQPPLEDGKLSDYISWMDDCLIGPPDEDINDDEVDLTKFHLEFTIDGPFSSEDYLDTVVDRLPTNCLCANLHISGGGFEEGRYDSLILCRPSDLLRVQQLLAKGKSAHFGYED
jgi:hypothetical protein